MSILIILYLTLMAPSVHQLMLIGMPHLFNYVIPSVEEAVSRKQKLVSPSMHQLMLISMPRLFNYVISSVKEAV